MKATLLTILVCVFSIQISNAQWVQTSNGLGDVIVYSLAANEGNIFVGTISNVLYLSTNNGITWTQSSLGNELCYSLATNGNNVFAGTGSHGVFLSTNNGISWNQTSLNNRTIRAFAISGSNIFAGASSGDQGVLLSTDNGISWTQTALINKICNALVVSGNNIFAGTSDSGVFLSTNNGTSWEQTSLNNRSVRSLTISGNNIFAGSGQGVLLSTDNGTSWTQTPLMNQIIFSLTTYGNNIYAGTGFNGGVYVSSNNGSTWIQRNEGLGNLYIYAFCVLNNNIFVGTAGKSVYKRPLSELTGIQPVSNEITDNFSLSQNYPNPFNPLTQIGFGISELGFVSLKIYSALGREVQTLVSEKLSPGTYIVEFSGNDLPSGVYFYKIQSGHFSEVKKMFLLK
jgi:photosystem II stability/assembly factor-like uncharacterized protein